MSWNIFFNSLFILVLFGLAFYVLKKTGKRFFGLLQQVDYTKREALKLVPLLLFSTILILAITTIPLRINELPPINGLFLLDNTKTSDWFGRGVALGFLATMTGLIIFRRMTYVRRLKSGSFNDEGYRDSFGYDGEDN